MIRLILRKKELATKSVKISFKPIYLLPGDIPLLNLVNVIKVKMNMFSKI